MTGFRVGAGTTTDKRCNDCDRPAHYDYDRECYVHDEDPQQGCFLIAGVAVILFDDDTHTCQPDPDLVPVSMCGDCYCSIANGLDSIDVSDERRDEIAAGLVSAGPRAIIDTEDEGGFSWWPCDVCGTRLGGNRFRGWIRSTVPDPDGVSA